MARIVSFLVLVAILVITSIIFFQVMAGFFVPLFLAALLGVVVQPIYRWILARCRGYSYVAAGITTALVAVMILLPIGLVVTTATLEGISLIDELQLADVRQKLDQFRGDFHLQIPYEQDIRHIEATLRNWRDHQRSGEPLAIESAQVHNLQVRLLHMKDELEKQDTNATLLTDAEDLDAQLKAIADSEPGSVERDDALQQADAEFRKFKRELLGGTYRAWLTELANPTDQQIDTLRQRAVATSAPALVLGSGTVIRAATLLFGIAITLVTLFFLLAEGSRMLDAIIKISPLEEQHVRELAAEFDRACRAIVSATLLSAIVQGLLAGIGFYVCGLRSSVALLTLLTMVLALVPFTGAATVWIPVALYLYFVQHNATAAIGLAVYGTLIISASDNVIKPLVLHGQSKLHPLLALLSVLGGIQALGPIGIVVGPMVVVFLQTILKIVQRELLAMDKSSWTFWRGLSPPISREQTCSRSAEAPHDGDNERQKAGGTEKFKPEAGAPAAS